MTSTPTAYERYLDAAARDPFPAGRPTQAVEIVRLTYDAYEATARDLFGRVIACRTYAYGRRRREFAVEQARQWADRFYLYLDPVIHD